MRVWMDRQLDNAFLRGHSSRPEQYVIGAFLWFCLYSLRQTFWPYLSGTLVPARARAPVHPAVLRLRAPGAHADDT